MKCKIEYLQKESFFNQYISMSSMLGHAQGCFGEGKIRNDKKVYHT